MSRWNRTTVKMPIAMALALVLLVRTLATIGLYAPRETGPQPEGESIVGGVVLGYDAADGADVAIAEVRGRRNHPGEVREMLYLVRAPFADADFESLGRGGTLGEVSPDGRSIAWLASKERGDRTGPGRLRLAEKESQVAQEKSLLSGLSFHPGRATAVGLTQYQAASGRGTLFLFDIANGGRRMLTPNVPPGGFAALDDGRTLAIRRPLTSMSAEAVVLGDTGAPAPPIATNVDWNDPRPAFQVAPGSRSVVLRVAGDDERRSLVRWNAGDAAASTIATGISAWTLDRTGAAWWVDETAGSLRVFREGTLTGTAAGTNARSVHPLPSGDGAWIAVADTGSTLRLVLAGSGPPPPAVPIRHVVSPPSGWPIAALGPLDAGPALVAASYPDAPVTLASGGVITAAFSASGRHLAAHVSDERGERVVLLDLETGTQRLLSEHGDRGGNPAPLGILSWHGETLLHVWRNREWRLDPRNGLYRVTPSP